MIETSAYSFCVYFSPWSRFHSQFTKCYIYYFLLVTRYPPLLAFCTASLNNTQTCLFKCTCLFIYLHSVKLNVEYGSYSLLQMHYICRWVLRVVGFKSWDSLLFLLSEQDKGQVTEL